MPQEVRFEKQEETVFFIFTIYATLDLNMEHMSHCWMKSWLFLNWVIIMTPSEKWVDRFVRAWMKELRIISRNESRKIIQTTGFVQVAGNDHKYNKENLLLVV